MGRLVIYEGSDEEIQRFLTSLPQHVDVQPAQTHGGAGAGNGRGAQWDAIAQAFHNRLQEAAAYGRKGQMNAMIAWLRSNGSIELSKLWGASGVANQHDYGGIGSSLTRNMKKVGGMRKWYTAEKHPTNPNEWVYKIVPELVEPLSLAFANWGNN